jgi:rhodanese-related sulfurtransferase
MQQQIFQFIAHHWVLVSLFFIILLAIIVYEIINAKAGGKRISPQQAVLLMNHQHAVVVDLRSSEVFKKGHIIDALNIPAADLLKDQAKIEKHKEKPIVLVCAMGQQAPKVAEQLKKQGFHHVTVLNGGLQAWQSASLPLVKE